MSLLERVERAQRRADTPDASVEPVAPHTPPTVTLNPAQVAAREEALRVVRASLIGEVTHASHSLFEATDAADLRTKVEGIVDRVIAGQTFTVTRPERQRLIDDLIGEVSGLGPLEPLLADETITEIMVNGPNHVYIERAGKIERIDSVFLGDEHVLRDHRPDHHPARPAHRQDEPARRCTPARRLARQRRSSSRCRWSARSSPSGSSPPGRITVDDLIRFGTATPEMFDFLTRLRRGSAQHLRLRRHGLRARRPA